MKSKLLASHKTPPLATPPNYPEDSNGWSLSTDEGQEHKPLEQLNPALFEKEAAAQSREELDDLQYKASRFLQKKGFEELPLDNDTNNVSFYHRDPPIKVIFRNGRAWQNGNFQLVWEGASFKSQTRTRMTTGTTYAELVTWVMGELEQGKTAAASPQLEEELSRVDKALTKRGFEVYDLYSGGKTYILMKSEEFHGVDFKRVFARVYLYYDDYQWSWAANNAEGMGYDPNKITKGDTYSELLLWLVQFKEDRESEGGKLGSVETDKERMHALLLRKGFVLDNTFLDWYDSPQGDVRIYISNHPLTDYAWTADDNFGRTLKQSTSYAELVLFIQKYLPPKKQAAEGKTLEIKTPFGYARGYLEIADNMWPEFKGKKIAYLSYVKVTKRRAGIGSELVNEFLESATLNGAEMCYLHCSGEGNMSREELEGFYKKLGFQTKGGSLMYQVLSEESMPMMAQAHFLNVVARPTDAKIKLITDRFKLTPEQVEMIIKADPTEKDYVAWIAKQFAEKTIRLPEDTEKIHGQLADFERLKRSPKFKGEKDIQQYTPATLFDTLEESKEQVSNKDLKRNEVATGAQIIYNQNDWIVYQVTTPEALMELSSNTNWCTAHEDFAEQYLAKGPNYVFYQNGKPYAQFDPDSDQFLDRRDGEIFLPAGKAFLVLQDKLTDPLYQVVEALKSKVPAFNRVAPLEEMYASLSGDGLVEFIESLAHDKSVIPLLQELALKRFKPNDGIALLAVTARYCFRPWPEMEKIVERHLTGEEEWEIGYDLYSYALDAKKARWEDIEVLIQKLSYSDMATYDERFGTELRASLTSEDLEGWSSHDWVSALLFAAKRTLAVAAGKRSLGQTSSRPELFDPILKKLLLSNWKFVIERRIGKSGLDTQRKFFNVVYEYDLAPNEMVKARIGEWLGDRPMETQKLTSKASLEDDLLNHVAGEKTADWVNPGDIEVGDSVIRPDVFKVTRVYPEGDEIVVMGGPGTVRRYDKHDEVAVMRKRGWSEDNHRILQMNLSYTVDEAEVGDYDFAVVETPFLPDVYQLGLVRKGERIDDQTSRPGVTPGKGSRREVKALLDSWLQKYNRLYAVSHNPDHNENYIKLLQAFGYRVQKGDIVGVHPLTGESGVLMSNVPYIELGASTRPNLVEESEAVLASKTSAEEGDWTAGEEHPLFKKICKFLTKRGWAHTVQHHGSVTYGDASFAAEFTNRESWSDSIVWAIWVSIFQTETPEEDCVNGWQIRLDDDAPWQASPGEDYNIVSGTTYAEFVAKYSELEGDKQEGKTGAAKTAKALTFDQASALTEQIGQKLERKGWKVDRPSSEDQFYHNDNYEITVEVDMAAGEVDEGDYDATAERYAVNWVLFRKPTKDSAGAYKQLARGDTFAALIVALSQCEEGESKTSAVNSRDAFHRAEEYLLKKNFWCKDSYKGPSGVEVLYKPETEYHGVREISLTLNGDKFSWYIIRPGMRGVGGDTFSSLVVALNQQSDIKTSALISKEDGTVVAGVRNFRGLPIFVENPVGTMRHNKTLLCDYGYIPGTTGAGDGEDVDVFVGADENAPYAYVVTQLKEDDSFDEFKVLLGFDSLQDAQAAYLAQYEEGWLYNRVESIVERPVEEFVQVAEKYIDLDPKQAAAPESEWELYRKMKRYIEKAGYTVHTKGTYSDKYIVGENPRIWIYLYPPMEEEYYRRSGDDKASWELVTGDGLTVQEEGHTIASLVVLLERLKGDPDPDPKQASERDEWAIFYKMQKHIEKAGYELHKKNSYCEKYLVRENPRRTWIYLDHPVEGARASRAGDNRTIWELVEEKKGVIDSGDTYAGLVAILSGLSEDNPKQAARDEDSMFDKMKLYLERQGYTGRWYGTGKTQTYIFNLEGNDRIILWPPGYYSTTGWDTMINGEPGEAGDSLSGLMVWIQGYQASHGQSKESSVDEQAEQATHDKIEGFVQRLGYKRGREQTRGSVAYDLGPNRCEFVLWPPYNGTTTKWMITAVGRETQRGRTYSEAVCAILAYREESTTS
jgi:ribosomal protein S18 acetylase RimI-like enzyme